MNFLLKKVFCHYLRDRFYSQLQKKLLNFPDTSKNIFFLQSQSYHRYRRTQTYTNNLLSNQRATKFLLLYMSLFNPLLRETIFFQFLKEFFTWKTKKVLLFLGNYLEKKSLISLFVIRKNYCIFLFFFAFQVGMPP